MRRQASITAAPVMPTVILKWRRLSLKLWARGEIAFRDFPEVLKGKYQNFTESDQTRLLASGYDQGFTDMEEAVKEYVDFLDHGGYYEYGK